jgi:hypothetical protein
MLTLLDTNVLLRAAEPSHSQHEVAVSALRALPKRGYKPCIDKIARGDVDYGHDQH